MQQLELDRQKFEKQMADDQRAIMLKLDKDQKNLVERLDSKNRRIQYLLMGIALVEIVVGILQLFYPAGLPVFTR